MNDIHDIALLIKSRTPIILIESHEEQRVTNLIWRAARDSNKPIYQWSALKGLVLYQDTNPQVKRNLEAKSVLEHIHFNKSPGVYILADFHPYLEDPLVVRLIKEVAMNSNVVNHTLVFISHRLDIPPELSRLTAKVDISLPTQKELEEIVVKVADEWAKDNGKKTVKTDTKTFSLLVNNLSGLTFRDAQQIARNVIYDDGLITKEDIPEIVEAKYQILNREGVLSFEYNTARFSAIGGFRKLKTWLDQRRDVFHKIDGGQDMDKPKGILLLGVQGCGKSLAAKAVAGLWGVPLLRMDFGSLYNKFYGETERNLRESLKTAEAMQPCILWMDEIEKGIASDSSDGGTSKRVLGTLLTWMAEKTEGVFIVATANDISALPPELVRKGRFDEIFFVDLPRKSTREIIFNIHLGLRSQDKEKFDAKQLAVASEGFSGAEIEQAIVSSLYAAKAANELLSTELILEEIQQTKPLSVVMVEKITALRAWAADRTVPAD